MEITLKLALQEAGKILMNYFGKQTSYTQKGSQSSIVTEADLESEHRIMELVRTHYPGHNTLGEETGFQDRSSEYTWVVDPLDGTSNFAAGIPWFGIIICILKKGKPWMAGCFLPASGELYFSEKGKGTFRNGTPVFVSEETHLKNVLFGYGLDYSDDFSITEAHAGIFGELVKNTRNLRATNCLIDFCYTADGRLGGCINQATKIWDIAGPALLIEEAGGIFSNIRGEPVELSLNESDYDKNYAVLAGNKILHQQIIGILNHIKN